MSSLSELLSPEDRVTKSMEFAEDLHKKSEFCSKQEAEKEQIFPKPGEKVSSDAKKFIERLKTVRNELNKLDEEIKFECAKFSEDVKYFAEFQTGHTSPLASNYCVMMVPSLLRYQGLRPLDEESRAKDL